MSDSSRVAALRACAATFLVLLVATACSYTPDWAGPARPGAAGEGSEHLERTITKMRERDRAASNGTLGVNGPIRTRSKGGWAGQRLWHRRANDWEPTLAADPSSPHVYQLTTRYGKPECRRCPDPHIVFRSSDDGGETWGADTALCECRGGAPQYDPQIRVGGDGSVHAAWLDGARPGVAYSRSTDHGRTWSSPVHLDGDLAFSDRPLLAVSPDGDDVYVAFTSTGSFVASSHDGGRSFSRPVKTNTDRRLYFTGGGYVAPDGRVTFAQTSYPRRSGQITHETPPPGRVHVLAVSSTDGGRTWRRKALDTYKEWPACFSRSCPEEYYGPQAVLGGDERGRMILVSNGTFRAGGDQRVFVRRSSNGGRTWSARKRLSPRHANAAFPAAIGTGDGDFRIWFMDDRTGGDDSWNVWYRRSSNGGKRWTRPVRISDAVSGTSYKKRKGFLEPYGDYGEIAVTSAGRTIAIWGEGRAYAGPGGTWFNRQAR